MKHCLIVDDSRVIRKVSRHIVESFEFEVTEAENGQDALAQCEEGMPDLILLDWNMPVMNGIEFISELHRLNGGAAPKVVFCTTENDVAHIPPRPNTAPNVRWRRWCTARPTLSCSIWTCPAWVVSTLSRE